VLIYFPEPFVIFITNHNYKIIINFIEFLFFENFEEFSTTLINTINYYF